MTVSLYLLSNFAFLREPLQCKWLLTSLDATDLGELLLMARHYGNAVRSYGKRRNMPLKSGSPSPPDKTSPEGSAHSRRQTLSRNWLPSCQLRKDSFGTISQAVLTQVISIQMLSDLLSYLLWSIFCRLRKWKFLVAVINHFFRHLMTSCWWSQFDH